MHIYYFAGLFGRFFFTIKLQNMIQQYNQYTAEQQWVWAKLFSRQQQNLLTKGTLLHNENVGSLVDVFNENEIPHLDKLSAKLYEMSGWQIHIVKGFIPATEFLNLLAQKKFAASTWLRSPSELDYLEEPDMFHDVFGHLPILCNKEYAHFVNSVGKLGEKYQANENCINLIERFYWYTIEFGLIKEAGETKILGAGIISSYGETNRIFEDGTIQIKPFNINEILYLPFDKTSLQPVYYLAASYEQLYYSLSDLNNILEKENMVGMQVSY